MGSWGLDAILSFLRYERARDNAKATNRRKLWPLKILGQTAASTASRTCLWIIVRSSAHCPQERHPWGHMGSFFLLKLIYCLPGTRSLHFCDLLIGHPWLQIQIIDPNHISLRRVGFSYQKDFIDLDSDLRVYVSSIAKTSTSDSPLEL